MAGSSGTPLPKKLGIKAGSRVQLVGAPAAFWASLEPELPAGAVLVETTADVALVFSSYEAQLLPRIDGVRATLPDTGALWVAWPKRASKQPTDLDENRMRALLLPTGLVDNKVCAIDEVWTGLRFVKRLALRR